MRGTTSQVHGNGWTDCQNIWYTYLCTHRDAIYVVRKYPAAYSSNGTNKYICCSQNGIWAVLAVLSIWWPLHLIQCSVYHICTYIIHSSKHICIDYTIIQQLHFTRSSYAAYQKQAIRLIPLVKTRVCSLVIYPYMYYTYPLNIHSAICILLLKYIDRPSLQHPAG